MNSLSTNHKGFNLFVQGVQDAAYKWGLETGFDRVGIYSMFYVIWNDKKWYLAREVPFVKDGDRDAKISPDDWIKVQATMAGALVS